MRRCVDSRCKVATSSVVGEIRFVEVTLGAEKRHMNRFRIKHCHDSETGILPPTDQRSLTKVPTKTPASQIGLAYESYLSATVASNRSRGS